jgi:hypothetical protein
VGRCVEAGSKCLRGRGPVHGGFNSPSVLECGQPGEWFRMHRTFMPSAGLIVAARSVVRRGGTPLTSPCPFFTLPSLRAGGLPFFRAGRLIIIHLNIGLGVYSLFDNRYL